MCNGESGHNGWNTEQTNGDRETHSINIIELGCLRSLQSSVKVNNSTSQKDCSLRQVLTAKYTKLILISTKGLSFKRGDFLPSSVQNQGFLRPLLIVTNRTPIPLVSKIFAGRSFRVLADLCYNYNHRTSFAPTSRPLCLNLPKSLLTFVSRFLAKYVTGWKVGGLDEAPGNLSQEFSIRKKKELRTHWQQASLSGFGWSRECGYDSALGSGTRVDRVFNCVLCCFGLS